MNEQISSTKNPKIKFILSLQKSSERRKHNLFLVEGLREIELALSAGHTFHSVYICNEIAGKEITEKMNFVYMSALPIEYIHRNVFDKLAYRENSDGLIAIAIPKKISLENLLFKKNPLIIVIESVEKPGNIGAILRTADAAGVDAVIICNPRTDLYNPNVIRSSVGCIFTNQVIVSNSGDVKKWLKENKINVFAATLNAETVYHQVNFTLPFAIIMGTEDKGLSDNWLTADLQQIKIPMNGKIDSLNVSNATAIIVFEALRQRAFKF